MLDVLVVVEVVFEKEEKDKKDPSKGGLAVYFGGSP